MTAFFGVVAEADAGGRDDPAGGAAGGLVVGNATRDPWPPHPALINKQIPNAPFLKVQ